MMVRARPCSGATAVGVLCVVAFLGLVGVGSYVLGRDVIGEEYLKPRASPVAPAGGGSEPSTVQSAPKAPPLLGTDPFAFLSKPKPAPARPDETQASAAGQGGEETSKPAGPRRFTIQVGVFLSPENSRLLQEDLRNRGYSSRVSEDTASGRTVHKVQIGQYNSREDAQRTADELAAQGYRVNVIPQG